MNYSPDNEPAPSRLRGKTITRKQLEITTTTTTTTDIPDSQPVSRDFVGYGVATLRDDDDDDDGDDDGDDEKGVATPTRQPFTGERRAVIFIVRRRYRDRPRLLINAASSAGARGSPSSPRVGNRARTSFGLPRTWVRHMCVYATLGPRYGPQLGCRRLGSENFGLVSMAPSSGVRNCVIRREMNRETYPYVSPRAFLIGIRIECTSLYRILISIYHRSPPEYSLSPSLTIFRRSFSTLIMKAVAVYCSFLL